MALVGVFFCFLLAFGFWTLIFPHELKSVIYYGNVFYEQMDYGWIKCLIVSFTVLIIFNIIFLKYKHFTEKKNFILFKNVSIQINAMRPLLLFIFSPIRVFKSTGTTIAWFDQTTFYFTAFFILVLGMVIYNFFRMINIKPTCKTIKKWLLGLFVVGFLFFGYFSILRLFDLTIEKPDSHAFVSVFGNTSNGDILRYTYLGGVRNWFGLHFEPLVFLFIPIYWLKISETMMPILLQMAQVVIGVSGIFPIFLFARKKLHSDFLGFIFGLIYLLFPALQFQILYDFHIEIISLTAILWSIFFLEQKRYKIFLFSLAIAIFSREEFALYASFFGFYLFFKNEYFQKRKLGFFLLCFGSLYLFLTKFFIIPYFGQGELVPAQTSMFSHLKDNLFSGSAFFSAKLSYLINFMFTERKIQYLFLMFLSVGFLAILSPIILFSIPFFVINLLLNFDLPSSIFWHYQSWLIPILIWATIDFVANKKKLSSAFTVFILLVSFLTSLCFGPFNLLNLNFGNTQKGVFQLKKNVEIKSLEEIGKLIPRDKSLSCDTSLAPFFANRRDFYLFPNNTDTDYIVTSLKSFSSHPQLHLSLIKNGYCLKGTEGILVYKKSKNCDSLWQDNLVEVQQTLSLDSESVKVIFAKNISALSMPISPKNLNLPATLILKISFDKNMVSENSMHLIDYQILANYPSLVKVEASPDEKIYQTVTTCSALLKAHCIFRFDVTRFVNKNGEIYLKFYLFADSLSSEKSTDVLIEWLSTHTIAIIPNFKKE